jgi:diguanylate cyclase (GGDEF)-like protein
MRDALTSLANRRALETYGPRLIAQSHEAGRPASVILCDIDHFKQINDIHGHPAGDTVLQKTANALSSQVRKSDLVARYGGEEFIIILPGSPLAPALRLAERMRAAVEEETVKHEDLELRRTASFGVATAFPEEPLSLPELVKRADANLYRAKRDGRNQVKSDELIPEHF